MGERLGDREVDRAGEDVDMPDTPFPAGAASAEVPEASTPDGAEAEHASLQASMGELLGLFNTRLRYDARKDELIQKLTDRLAELTAEARSAAMAPLLHDIILLRDSIVAFRSDVSDRESWPAADLQGRIDVLLSEVTEALERQDVYEYIATGERATDLKYQRAVRTIPTGDPAEDGRVMQVVRPGYVAGDIRLRPQEVVVAKYQQPHTEE